MRVYEKVRTYMANNDLKQQMSQRKQEFPLSLLMRF